MDCEIKKKILRKYGDKALTPEPPNLDLFRPTPLHQPCDESMARAVIESLRGVSVEEYLLTKNVLGFSPLHVASRFNQLDTVKFILSQNINHERLILTLNKLGESALHISPSKDIAEVIVTALPHRSLGKLLNQQNLMGETVLHIAVSNSRWDMLTYLLSLDIDRDLLLLKSCDELHHDIKPWKITSGTVLHRLAKSAAEISQYSQVLQAVSFESMSSLMLALNYRGETALHIACKENNDKAVSYLLSQEVDNDKMLSIMSQECALDKQHSGTALHYASSKYIADVLINATSGDFREEFVFLQNYRGETALLLACADGKAELVEFILSLDFRNKEELVIDSDRLYKTPLHWCQDVAIARCLMKVVNSTDQRISFLQQADLLGETALHIGCKEGKTDFVRYILSLEANNKELLFRLNENVEKRINGTPLHVAANTEIAQALVNSVCSEERSNFILMLNEFDETVLHIASKSGQLDIVLYILSLDVDIEELLFQQSECADGDISGTALHVAANREIAEVLIGAVSNERRQDFVLEQNILGQNAYQTACIGKHVDVMEYLLNISEHDTELKSVPDAITEPSTSFRDIEGIFVYDQPEELFRCESITQPDTDQFNSQRHSSKPAISQGRDLGYSTFRAACVDRITVVIKAQLHRLSLSDWREVFETDHRCGSVLHHAGDRDVADLLLSKLAKEQQCEALLAEDREGLTPLHTACKDGRHDVLQYFLTLKLIEVDRWFTRNVEEVGTALHCAADQTTARLILQAVPKEYRSDFIEFHNKHTETALHLACDKGLSDIAFYLLAEASDKDKLLFTLSVKPEGQNECSGSALHYAANIKIAKLLVNAVSFQKRREFVELPNQSGYPAVYVAERRQRQDVVDFLSSTSSLTVAEIPIENRREVDLVLAHNTQQLMRDLPSSERTAVSELSPADLPGLQVPRKNDRSIRRDIVLCKSFAGETSLHSACKNGNRDAVMSILESVVNGKILLQQDDKGNNALHLATNAETAKLLLTYAKKHNCHDELVHATDSFGFTPLHIACRRGRTDVMEYFMSQEIIDRPTWIRSNIDQVGSPLNMAGNEEIAEMLVCVMATLLPQRLRSSQQHTLMGHHHFTMPPLRAKNLLWNICCGQWMIWTKGMHLYSKPVLNLAQLYI